MRLDTWNPEHTELFVAPRFAGGSCFCHDRSELVGAGMAAAVVLVPCLVGPIRHYRAALVRRRQVGLLHRGDLAGSGRR